jgi:hypothetical protein
MSRICVACCETSITKVNLFACSDTVNVSLNNALSARQVICTSGSVELPDKSYNSFVVCVQVFGDFS